RAAVEAHLATCSECQEALAMYQHFYTLLRSPLRLDAAPLLLTVVPEQGGPAGAQSTQHHAGPSVRPLIPTEPPGAPVMLPGPHRQPSARLTALEAVAALLVVALLAGVLLTLRATVSNRPAPHPTPSPRCCTGVTEFPLPAHGRGPLGITVGPDG